MIPLVDLQAEYNTYGPEVLNAVTAVAQSGKYILGPQVKTLEQKLSQYTQPRDNARPMHCITVSDGTAALQLCLMALQLRPEHEVITVPFTWISTAEVIALVGAQPVFVDIDPVNYTIDLAKLADALTPRTRAVIVVSLYGFIPDLKAIRHVLDCAESKHWTRIALIEDGAQSFGAIRNGHVSCGSPHATLSTTSFFPTKPLGCYGDGGAVFTQDAKMATTVAALRVHGRNTQTGLNERVGLNSRLDTVQAAVLLTKVSRFNGIVRGRVAVARRYNSLLSSDPRIIIPNYENVKESDDSFVHIYGVYTIRIRERDEVASALKQKGVACAVYYPICLHQQPMFRNTGTDKRKVTLPIAEKMCKQVLSLPMHPLLNERTQDIVVRDLTQCLDECGVKEPPN